jgi:hypothetical protein
MSDLVGPGRKTSESDWSGKDPLPRPRGTSESKGVVYGRADKIELVGYHSNSLSNVASI